MKEVLNLLELRAKLAVVSLSQASISCCSILEDSEEFIGIDRYSR